MTNENMTVWNAVKRPPTTALKQIVGGRLKGMTDISPQWRYKALTETFGPCGTGWKYEVVHMWERPSKVDDQVAILAQVNLYTSREGIWSEPIPGVGGSMEIAKEKNGSYFSDEAYKMAITDALSVCCKMLGVGADIYEGSFDGTTYREEPVAPTPITDQQVTALTEQIISRAVNIDQFLAYAKVHELREITSDNYDRLMQAVMSKPVVKGVE